jgi:hypothetical protein
MTGPDLPGTLREYARLLTPALDLSAAKDRANCHPTADVVVADETILEDVPVTYPMSLEHQLTEVLGFMRALQLTDPAEDWVWDENDACWPSRNPEQRLRMEKGLKSLVLIAPTQHQPGQAQAVPDEHRTGVWEITKFSGAVGSRGCPAPGHDGAGRSRRPPGLVVSGVSQSGCRPRRPRRCRRTGSGRRL